MIIQRQGNNYMYYKILTMKPNLSPSC